PVPPSSRVTPVVPGRVSRARRSSRTPELAHARARARLRKPGTPAAFRADPRKPRTPALAAHYPRAMRHRLCLAAAAAGLAAMLLAGCDGGDGPPKDEPSTPHP